MGVEKTYKERECVGVCVGMCKKSEGWEEKCVGLFKVVMG